MGITKQEAAAQRAQAAKSTEAKDRLSALEVERQGYVQRGDKKGVKAIDDEIAHWSNVARIPVESGPVAESASESTSTGADRVAELEQELALARDLLKVQDEEHGTLAKTHSDTLAELTQANERTSGIETELTQARERITELEKELGELKAQTPAKTAETPATPAQAAATSGGRAKAAAAAKG